MTPTRFDAELIRRYDRAGPRYTSYPTAVQFSEQFGVNEYRAAARASNLGPAPKPLSLYVHVPFCASPCFYCGCTKVVTPRRDKAGAYLQRLFREIELQGALYHPSRKVEQLHFGGGTPTFLDRAELEGLFDVLRRHFSLSVDAGREFSIELDPRTVDRDRLRDLVELGFNRCSLGVQDFDSRVQQAVNRVQSAPDTLQLIHDARAVGFNSVSVDLIYGLPKQTPEGFAKTIDTVLTARPDRLAVYAYAHLPELFKAQRQLNAADLPTPDTRLALLGRTIEQLGAAGYVYVGMDHFALPTDELVRAQNTGTLQRNFQGYSTRGACDLIGLGVSSIGKVGDAYMQNRKTLPEYYEALDRNELPVHRGLSLTRDDVVRRDVIQQLMCAGALDFEKTGQRFGFDFEEKFADELRALEPMIADGLAERTAPGLRVLPRGRLLLRHLAMAFDAHLAKAQSAGQRFSKAV